MNAEIRSVVCAGLAVVAAILSVWPQTVRAEDLDPKIYLAQFFDGMRNRDYPKAMRGFLAIVALDGKAPAAGQADCFSALKTGDAARSATNCTAFAKISGDDPRAHVGVALADVIGERPLEAVKSLDTAMKLDPRNLPAFMLRSILAAGGAGNLGDGWAVPASSSRADLEQALRDFESGNFAAAAASFETMFKAGQVHGNVPLMLFIARKRSGLPTTGAELEPMRDVGGARYRMLISALKGDVTSKEALRDFLSNWGEGNDYAADRFFLGEAALLQGDKAEAKRYFTKTVAVPRDSTETRLAKTELARLP
jgi:hypothetical protein